MTLAPCVICDRPTALVKVGWHGIPPEVVCGICMPVVGRQIRALKAAKGRRFPPPQRFCHHPAEDHIPSDWDASRPCGIAGCPCLGGHV